MKMYSHTVLKKEFEAYLNSTLGEARWQGELYDPIKYILKTPAKRVRPTLFLLTYQALRNGSVREVLNVAFAIELFHTFTLVHDDIMDHAPIRRGVPAIHARWGTNTAILAGDALFAFCMEYLARGEAEMLPALLQEFSGIALEVCEGQEADLRITGRPETSLEEYLEMIRKKTAVLIGGSMSLAGIAAGVDPEIAGLLYEYGESVGMAFQLQDDYLDLYGDREVLGKQIGGDLKEKKITFPVLKALERADEQDASMLRGLFNGTQVTDDKIAEVIHVLDRLEVQASSKDAVKAYMERAERTGEKLADIEGFSLLADYLATLSKRQA